MAKVIISIEKDEIEEVREIQAYIESLTEEQRIKIKGFLEGIRSAEIFMRSKEKKKRKRV